MPFAAGWYAVVLVRIDPRRWVISLQRADSNWAPRSVVIVDGMPNREIHPLRNAWAVVLAVMSDIGNASGQRVKWSTQVNR